MKKRNIMATSSIAVALFLSSYSSTQAANFVFSKPRTYSLTQSSSQVEVESEYAGVSAADFREELGMDPTFTQSLVDQGFSSAQIQKIFASASLKNDFEKIPLSE